MSKERLQKVLSQAGIGSRREMEGWIEQGMVTVNGDEATLGMSVGPDDKIGVKGKLIENPLAKEATIRVLVYHKPVGEISSRHDPKHERTVFDTLPYLKHGRWVQVGRLDINTSGLLLFTNNGELANQLMHPKFALEREYAVRVRGQVTEEAIELLLKGVMLEDGMAKFKRIEFKGGEGVNAWYHVTLTEGRNREVRRLWQSQGVEVSRLIRIRYGRVTMPRYLTRGHFKELTAKEIETWVLPAPEDDKKITPVKKHPVDKRKPHELKKADMSEDRKNTAFKKIRISKKEAGISKNKSSSDLKAATAPTIKTPRVDTRTSYVHKKKDSPQTSDDKRKK